MNNDTIIRLAQEAGLPTTIGWLDSIMRFAAAVAGVEREECARMCEIEKCSACAADIRSRGHA